MATLFKEIKIQGQKHYDSFSLPSVLVPNAPASDGSPLPYTPTLPLLLKSIKAEKPYLESLFHKTGAILLRGFPVSSPVDFNDVVEAFGFEDFKYGGQAPRTRIHGRVYTANESPPHLEIKFHHEMAQSIDVPGKLIFYCDVEPAVQGETPIALSHIIYMKMKERHPDFVERLEKHGLVYAKVLPEEDDPSMPIGRGWKSTFGTDDKILAQEMVSKAGANLEWLKNGSVKVSSKPVPGIRYDESRDRNVWFNSIVSVHVSAKDGGEDSGQSVTFGDGDPLPDKVVEDCSRILQEESVAIRWQKGDIMLVDNWALLHARRPSSLPRRVLVSLCK